MGDEMQHKTIWDTVSRQHVSILLFGTTLRGRMLGLAKHMLARVRRNDFQDAFEEKKDGGSAA